MGLKTSHYNSSVSGFAPTTVAAALDALAGVRISDMDSNSDGTYVRWENGLQVCYKRLNGTYLNDCYMRAQWSFPAVFGEAPIVVCAIEKPRINGRDDPYDISHNQHVAPLSTASVVIAVAVHSAVCIAGDNFNVNAIAIGKWK
ncbi:MAG: hypothetical protein VB144_11465 [Clostridia bacterium]|nr:hypothetical protein [Clostridia bacterium]